jgi:hypothetical protein
MQWNPCVVEITLKNGIVYSKSGGLSQRQPGNPMTMDEIIGNFKDCAAYAKKRLSGQQIEEIVQKVRNLEECEDVGEIISCSDN